MKEAVASIGQHSNMLPRNRGITLPLIDVSDNQLIVTRLIYFVRSIPNEGTYITPPQYIATYNLTKQQFLSLKKLDMEGLNKKYPYSPAIFRDPKDIIPEFERIWGLYNTLIPDFIKRQSGAADQRIQMAAKEYLRFLQRHQEKALQNYYEQYGGDFLSFVKTVGADQ